MKKQLSMVLAALMAASLVACGGASGEKKATEAESKANAESSGAEKGGLTWKIGGQGPLTGGAAVYGNAVVNGAEIAIDEINANGGINGYQIEYKKADDEHDQEKAINAYNSLKDWGMQFLVGPTTSAPAIAVGTEAEGDNMFLLSPSGSAVEVTAPKNVFRVCFSDPAQGTKSAEYIGSHNL